MRDREGERGANSDLHNPAAGKAGPSSGRKDSRLSEAKIEKALPVKGPETDGTLGAGLVDRPAGRMAPMQALLDLRLWAASCSALASLFSAAIRMAPCPRGVLEKKAARLGHYVRVCLVLQLPQVSP